MEKIAKTSTTKNQAWQVKGVTPETREAVKQAARKTGKTIGQWANETLHREAVADITGQKDLPATLELNEQLTALSAKLDEMRRPLWRKILGR
jgi:localization factor PodJL